MTGKPSPSLESAFIIMIHRNDARQHTFHKVDGDLESREDTDGVLRTPTKKEKKKKKKT